MGGNLKTKVFGLILAGVLVFVAGCSSTPEEKELGKDSPNKESQLTEESAYEKVDPKQDEQLLNSKVIYYETPKEKTPEVHKEAENLIQDLAKKKKVNIEADLNNSKYRDFVFRSATDLSSLDKDKQKKVVDFAKYVDKYENQIKNKRIQELMNKIKSGTKLTGKERAELDSLLPIKGGIKIQFQKEARPDQKPQEPVKTLPDKEGKTTGGQEKEDSNPDDNKTGTKTGGHQDDGSTDEGTQTGGKEPGKKIGGIIGGGSDENDDNEGTQTGGNEDEGNRQGGTDDEDQEEPGQDEGGRLIGGNDSPQTGSYDPEKAKNYAYKWWNKRNNEQYGYYSRVMGGCYDCWYDCTNFVSQAIKEGGIKERRNGTYWYYSDEKPAYAWGVANSFYKHFQTRAKQVRGLFDLEVGDVVNADFDHDGDIEHSAIVTKVTPNEVYVTQHTTDRKDAPLSAWFMAGYDVYGWKMKTANGD